MEFENYLNSLTPKKRELKPIIPPVSEEEKKLFLIAVKGTSEKKPIVTFGNPLRPDEFYIEYGIGKGPYHLFELPKNKTTNLAREWITHISALAKLYYDYDYPIDCIKYEYNYKYVDENNKTHHFPMDIVVFNKKSKDILLYVEVKKEEKEIKDLLDYLKNHTAPLISDKDRPPGVKNADEIRKAKYLWFSKNKFLWLICPENLKSPEDNFYEVNYDISGRKIILKEIKDGLKYIKSIIK